MQTGAAFRIDQLVVFRHLEHAATRTHQLDLGAGEFLFDARLQLESPGTVASGITVFDTNAHVIVSLSVRSLSMHALICKKCHEKAPPVGRGFWSCQDLVGSFLGGDKSMVAVEPSSPVQTPA